LSTKPDYSIRRIAGYARATVAEEDAWRDGFDKGRYDVASCLLAQCNRLKAYLEARRAPRTSLASAHGRIFTDGAYRRCPDEPVHPDIIWKHHDAKIEIADNPLAFFVPDPASQHTLGGLSDLFDDEGMWDAVCVTSLDRLMDIGVAEAERLGKEIIVVPETCLVVVDDPREGPKATEAAFAQDCRPGPPLKTPFGYAEGQPVPGQLVVPFQVVEEEAKIVRVIFQRLIAGQEADQVARWLRRVCPDRRWSKSAVKRLVRNRVYLGEANYGAGLKNSHEPIVTQEDFAATEKALTKWRRRQPTSAP
jgi:hypothetical protein